MMSKLKEMKFKIMTIVAVIAIAVGLLVSGIFSATDNHYVVDVVQETAENKDSNLQLTESIVKGVNAQGIPNQYFDSKKLDYEVELKNISQSTNKETQVAIVVDTSYSMEKNDNNKLVREKAIELAEGIMSGVSNSRISISNNDSRKLNMGVYNNNNIESTITNMMFGEGNDSNDGLINAEASFTTPNNNMNTVNKYIVVFTDATDNVIERMENISEDIKVISILVDMTSNSYIENGLNVRDDVYLLLNEVTQEDITENVNILDLQRIIDEMNKSTNKIKVTNTFNDAIINYFDITDPTTQDGVVTLTKDADNKTIGYTWEVDQLKYQRTAKLKFTIKLKTNIEINAGVIFEDLCTNKLQNIEYYTYDDSINVKTLEGTDSREGTESTTIKICQGYDLKIKAVNESNHSLEVEGVEFAVKGINEAGEEVCNISKTTDSQGYIIITPDEVKALRADGEITFTVTPSVNKVGYSDTDSETFAIKSNKTTKLLNWNEDVSILENKVDSEKRLVEVTIPINSQKIDFELRLEELNDDSVLIPGAEFQLIQPKLNNHYEMDVLTGTTDSTGTIHFAPTVMTQDGSYTYILRQVSTQSGYELTNLTLITLHFKDGIITQDPTTQFNPNVVIAERVTDANGVVEENHTLIVIGNENLQQDPFDIQINLKDSKDGTPLENVTYLLEVIDSNNQPCLSKYVVTDSNGQVNTQIYGNGNLIVKITEQAPKVGYVPNTYTNVLNVSRVNNLISVPNAYPTTLDVQTPNLEKVVVNLTSEKKQEQNIVHLTLRDAQEEDVSAGSGIKYTLVDNETGFAYGPEISNQKGEIAFTIDSKDEGSHSYTLVLDDTTIPDEYDIASNKVDINVNIDFDKYGYIRAEDVPQTNLVTDDYFSLETKETSLEYTVFLKIAYELELSNTVEFQIQLNDYEQISTPIEGAAYNIDIEWDVNGITKTKTIKERRTNANGLISTRIVRGSEVRITVTQVKTKAGYGCDLTVQEIIVHFYSSNGQPYISSQSPYDLGQTNTSEPNQGAEITNGVIVFKHLNKKRTAEDTYVNLTINKVDLNGMVGSQIPIKLKSSSLLGENNTSLDQYIYITDNTNGSITLDYQTYLQEIQSLESNTTHIIRVPGIGEEAEEIVYDLEINEAELSTTGNQNPNDPNDYEEKAGTTVRLRLIFRYKDNRVTLTNVETIYGNRLVKFKQFSSASDTAQGQVLEDSMGVYIANITLDLYTNYDDVGNLSLDFKKKDNIDNELAGSKYTVKVTNPDGTVLRKKGIEVKNGTNSDDIEISGLFVNVGSIIELSEETAPVGYGINGNTETLEVIDIAQDGSITLEQKDISYEPNRLVLTPKAPTLTAAGTTKTNYEITFIDYQLDTFKFGIDTVDENDLTAVNGYQFKINSSLGAQGTLSTCGYTHVGGGIENNTITYTITSTTPANYYKPLGTQIIVNVVFDQMGNVDPVATLAAQTDSNYGTLWNIKFTADQEIKIEVFVKHQNPLNVKVETIDKITNALVTTVDYKVTPSEVLPATGTNNIEVGYVLETGIITYTLEQTNIATSYAKATNKVFTVQYVNETINASGTYLQAGTTDTTLTVTGAQEVTIKVYVEPKVPFEITNLYYFDNTIQLQGANFEVEEININDIGTGTTDAIGKTGIYSGIFKETTTIRYRVSQTQPAIGYASIDDFYVDVTFNANKEITDVKLVDAYGNVVTNNRFVTVSYVTTSSYSNYNSNNKGIVTIQVLNYPEFKININNVDRRDGTTPVVGTEYSVKSTYTESDGSIINFTETSGVITDATGLGIAHLDRTKDDTIVKYTVKEEKPATGYQSLGTDINVIVTFDGNGYISNAEVENNSNLSAIESLSFVNPSAVIDPKEHFIVDLQLKNNPILKFSISKVDIEDHNTKVDGVGFTIVSTIGDTVYSNSSATNKVNQTETPEMSALTGSLGASGYTEMYMNRTVDNTDMYYTIKEVQKSPGYEWQGEDIILKISYDQNGKISSTPVATQGGTHINITEWDADNFEIKADIYNDEIKAFGIHLTAEDTYNTEKKLNDMNVEAWLTEGSSYVSDEKYELVGENSLLTGADRDGNGTPDITFGEDYKTIGEYTEGEGWRTLRLVIKNDVANGDEDPRSGYYLSSIDGSNSGANIGYYKGNQYNSTAKYQNVIYCYMIQVHFTDDGKIDDAKLSSGGLYATIGQWSVDTNYIQVEEGTLNISHTDYKLNVTMKFFPMLDLKLNAMDNYTYQQEVAENGLPIALEGSKYTVTTLRHHAGVPRDKDELVTAGYIGYGEGYGYYGSLWPGHAYESTKSELLVPIENNYTRLFYVFEQAEPTNYQKYTDRYCITEIQKLVAVIQVTFDEYGAIDYSKSIVRTADDGSTIHPYIAEDKTTYLSSNNIQKYNYFDKTDIETRNIDFYIGYGLTTKINITAVDDISGNGLSNIRLYPFFNTQANTTNNGDGNNVCVTGTSYEFNPISYRDTNTDGEASAKYWGAAYNNSMNNYIIGSSRQGNSYNGYLFPSDFATSDLGGSGNETDYYAKLDITYGDDGKISKVTSIGKDLWGDDNIRADITWDADTGNVYIKMLYSRKLQVTLDKVDYYDKTINDLSAAFDVVSNKGLDAKLQSDKMAPLGKVYKNETIKYTLSETEIPDGYYPIGNVVEFYVKFDQNGNIGTNTVNSNSDYFEVINTSESTERIIKNTPDLMINVKNKPAFNLDLRIIDQFYKNDGVQDIYLNVTNSKGDVALGNPQSDNNGYAKVVTGPVYPGETVKYYISQTNTANGYYQNATTIELEVTFSDIGKVDDYKILAGNQVVYNFNTTAYLNTRTISMKIMNMPKDFKIGIYKYDQLTEEPIPGVEFTISKENMTTGIKGNDLSLITNNDGYVFEVIDTFDTSLSGKVVKYTIHENTPPTSYRTMEDIVILVYYNNDGSISMCNQVANNNGILNSITPEVAINESLKLNDERVHMITNIPNDNAFDIVIKDEDTNYAGLGIQGSEYEVSVNGVQYLSGETDQNGKAIVPNLTDSGDITINIAQIVTGDGYRKDIDNNVEIKVQKGTLVYSLELDPSTPGFVNTANATTTKAIVEVDETYGKIYVTFKNETKTEINVIKQDIQTKQVLKDAEFNVVAQQIDDSGNDIGAPITLATSVNTDNEGKIYFDLGIAPQSQIWKYTFTELTPPQGYNAIVPLTMTVTYDQYGKIISQVSSKQSRLNTITEHPDNENCRNMYAMIYNGDVSPAYTVKVVTEDSDTGKRINDSEIYLNITDNDGNLIQVEPKTISSMNNGGTDITANLGIDGIKYTDEQLYAEDSEVPVIVEKGLVYIDNVDYEGDINIEVSQVGLANGYIYGNQVTNGNIKLNAAYIPHLDEDPTTEFTVIDNDGLEVRTDDTNRIITIVIKNESQVVFDILTTQYKSNPDEETIGIQNVNYNITAEIQTLTSSTDTGLNETTTLSDENGYTKGNAGKAYAGKTVVYTLHQNIVEGYKTIDDIKVEVQYNSKGYLKYYEVLTSEDNCYIKLEETEGRKISLVVVNRKDIAGYRIDVEKHAMDTEDDLDAYGTLLPGAKYRITVTQQFGVQNTVWTDVTDENGLIKGLVLDGYGYIQVVIEELEAPEGYVENDTQYTRLYRNPDTGEIIKVDGIVNIDDENIETDEEGNTIIKLMPIDRQASDKYTLIVNKCSAATQEFITGTQAKFNAELIRTDEDGNTIYKDTIGYFYTDINTGKATIDNLDLPGEEGEYKLVLTELEAPEGYILLSDSIEIPVIIEKDTDGNSIISSIDVEGIDNVSISKVKRQLIAINIFNEVDDPIKDNEYSLDITKVDAETNEAIEDMALFKVWLPDVNETSVYTETQTTMFGPGKLDYCWIEQDKDYQVRLTHMKLPEIPDNYDPNVDGPIVVEYTFREVVSPDGYQKIEDDLVLTIEFILDEANGKMYIANATSSDNNYLRINNEPSEFPMETSQKLSIDILNNTATNKIIYHANDNDEGTVVPDTQIKQKDVPIQISDYVPQRNTYVFTGWGIMTDAGIVPYIQPSDWYTFNQDLDLYAMWAVAEYNIIYDANDNGDGTGIIPPNQIKAYGQPEQLDNVSPISRTGYNFVEWNTEPDGTGTSYQPGDIYNDDNDLYLYAIWTLKTFTIHYEDNVNDEVITVPADQIITYGIGEIIGAEPTREGYDFVEWNTEPEGTGTSYQPGDTYSEEEDVNLYAIWKLKTYVIHYEDNVDDEVITVPADQTKTYGIDEIIGAEPTREGYDFVEWNTEPEGTGTSYQPGDTYSEEEDVNLYAIWKLKTYVIHYEDNVDDEEITVPEDQTKTNGVDITVDASTPVRPGYIFKGWATTDTATTAEYQPGEPFSDNKDTTLYAIWEEILYVKSTEYVISNEDNYVPNVQLEENIYEEGDTYILGILPKLSIEDEENQTEWTKGTKLEDFKDKIQTNADDIKLYDEDNNEITDADKYLGTSMIVEFIKGTQAPIRLTIVVRGDLNGDGILNLSDISRAKKYIKNDDKSILDTIAKKIAYDTNLDGKLNMKDSNNMARAQSEDDTRELKK